MTDGTRARRPLYRTVLSLAVAALVAVWLPFTVFYVSALHHHAAAQVSSVTYSHGRPVVITRTSGGQIIRTSAGTPGATQAQTLQPVTTHVS
jgi:uncharacterized membrane protein